MRGPATTSSRPLGLVHQAREAAGAGIHSEPVEGAVEARGRRVEDGGEWRASRGQAQGRRGERGEAGRDEVENGLLAFEDQLAGQGAAVGVAGLAGGPAGRDQEADDVLARAAGRVEERHGVGPVDEARGRPGLLRQVARGVHERVRPAAAKGRVLEPVRVVGAVPRVVAEHRPAPLGALSLLPSRRGERVAAAESGEGLGRQHLALRLARGAGVRGECHRPGLPGVAEVAAQRGQRAARLRRVDRAAEAGERRVDETDRRRALRVPVPDRRHEPLDLTRAVRAEIPVGAEGQNVPERVGRAEPLEAREPLPADALRVVEERAPLGVVVSAARPRVERDADAAAVGPLQDEQRRHLEAAPLGVVVEEGHGQPAHARPGQERGRTPGERGQLRVVRDVDRDAPGTLEAARGVERPQKGLLALETPEGVVQEGAEGDPALAKPPDELVLPLRVALEEGQGLVRDGHRVPVAVPLGLAVRAGHRVEVRADELGHVPSGGLLVEAPRVVGARVVHDVDRPARRARGRRGSRLGRSRQKERERKVGQHALRSLPSPARVLCRRRGIGLCCVRRGTREACGQAGPDVGARPRHRPVRSGSPRPGLAGRTRRCPRFRRRPSSSRSTWS